MNLQGILAAAVGGAVPEGFGEPQEGVQTPAEEPEAAGKPCRCGCGTIVRPGRKWGREGCRQRFYQQSHIVLDLGRRDPQLRAKAERMAGEAVAAAKLGQPRATVDARTPVQHEALNPQPDRRPSCRVRLNEELWQMLAEIQAFWRKGDEKPRSFSDIVGELVIQEHDNIRAKTRQEEEHEHL